MTGGLSGTQIQCIKKRFFIYCSLTSHESFGLGERPDGRFAYAYPLPS